MPDIGNLGTTISFNGKNGYYPLYPKTTESQILDYNIGKLYGPYNLTLPSAQWQNGMITLPLADITENDIPFVVKSLSGSVIQMKAQKEAYNLLETNGVESTNGNIIFRLSDTNKVPQVDINVQVYWTR